MTVPSTASSPALGRPARELFALDPNAVYLNHGGFGATPHSVLAAQADWIRRFEQQPVHFVERILPTALRDAAGDLAGYLGARTGDLVFVDNATSGVNAVLRSLDLQAGDELLITDHIYHACRQAVAFVCQRSGARMVEVELPYPAPQPAQIVELVTSAISSRTRLLVLDYITSPSALILPVSEICDQARQRGVPVLVDAAHAPGQVPLDVPSLGAQWVTGNAHKWLFAPKGCGFLWAESEVQSRTHPAVISRGYGNGFLAEFDWVGTRDPSPWLCVTDAIEAHRSLGGPQLMIRNHVLALEAAAVLEARLGVAPAAPDTMRAAMITVELATNGPASLDNARRLHDHLWNSHRIEIPVFPFRDRLWVRLAAQGYNELDEFELLADVLAQE